MSVLLPLLLLATPAAAQPTLTFASNWSVTTTGQPQTGTPLNIVYDLARLPQCRGASWGITGYYMTNHGTVHSFPVADATTPGTAAVAVLNPTLGGNLELWFRNWDSTGCSAWDSNLGWNFHFKVLQNPTLSFHDNWTHSLFGTLQGGTTLMVDYDIDRLGQCRAYYDRYTAWSVHVYYRIDGGPVEMKDLTVGWGEWNTEFRAQAPAFIPLPVGASTLEMWFYNGDRKNCSAYDSVNGQNYHFTIQ
jgi:hypothetical protein